MLPTPCYRIGPILRKIAVARQNSFQGYGPARRARNSALPSTGKVSFAELRGAPNLDALGPTLLIPFLERSSTAYVKDILSHIYP